MSQIIEVVERYEIPDFPDIDLPEEDGVPLETSWHRSQMNLLIENVKQYWHNRQDFFVGGNLFVYYSLNQVRNRDYKGPDFFVVKGVDGSYSRPKWVVWEENGRYPDVIIELMSPSTAQEDLGNKKALYEKTFHTANYYCYDPDKQKLYGWQLGKNGYEELIPDENGRLWCSELEVWIGLWEGEYLQEKNLWLRFFDEDENLIPIAAEAAWQQAEVAWQQAEVAWQQAEAEKQRAEAERQRAEKAEAELTQLKAELARRKGGSSEP